MQPNWSRLQGPSMDMGENVAGGTYTLVLLDRALVSVERSAQSPLACLSHIIVATSGQCALLLAQVARVAGEG
jgi:hypothetical protein